MRPLFTQRSVYGLLLILLCVKLGATVWSSSTHEQIVYDQHHHLERARSAGLKMTRMAYNPPLYYFAAAPVQKDDRVRLRVLKLTNVVWVGLFYIAWLFIILPRVVPQRRAQLVVGLLLLAIPGYQKLAAMVHPDNLHAALSAIALGAWLWFRREIESPPGSSWRSLLIVGFFISLAAWTRPFSAATVAALSLALTVSMWRGYGWSRRFVVRLLAVGALIGVLSSSWYVCRWMDTGRLGPAYGRGWNARYAKDRVGFDFVHYYGSFYFKDLVKTPHRTDKPRIPDIRGVHNSFFTLMYSEVWGDHWLYYSGRKGTKKQWPKRILFVAALPLIPFLLWGWARTIGVLSRRKRAFRTSWPVTMLALYALMGFALYVAWQTQGGLTPGKNSGVKFIYNAYAFPLGLAFAFVRPLSARRFDAWVAYGLLLNLLALPIAIYWPN